MKSRYLGNNAARSLAVAVGVVLLIFLRQPGQFLYPQFWVEGSYIYFYASFDSLLSAIYGYLCLVQKLVVLLFCPLAPQEFHPHVCVGVTVGLVALLSYYFASTPSRLPLIGVFLLGIVLTPQYGSEVYAKMLYLMWVLPFAILLVIFRRTENLSTSTIVCDVILVALAGLSGPIIFILLPALLYVTALKRNKYFFILSFVALVCAGIQLYYLKSYPQSALPSAGLSITPIDIAKTLLSNFLPQYLQPGLLPGGRWGLAIFIFIALLVFSLNKKDKFEASVLLVLFLSASVPPIIKLAPYSAVLLNPVNSGSSRYFLYPFIAITFYLLLVAIKGKVWGKVIAIAILSYSFYSNLPGFQADYFDYRWGEHIRMSKSRECNARVPVAFSGREGKQWTYRTDPTSSVTCSDADISVWRAESGGEVQEVSSKKLEFISPGETSVFTSVREVGVKGKTFVNFGAHISLGSAGSTEVGVRFFGADGKVVRDFSQPVFFSSLFSFCADIPEGVVKIVPYIKTSGAGTTTLVEPSILLF